MSRMGDKDTIYRQDAIDALWQAEKDLPYYDSAQVSVNVIKEVPPAQLELQWIPCTPSELPKDKMLWVTHDTGLYRYVGTVLYDMTEWSEPVSDVVAYMEYEVPEPYEGNEGVEIYQRGAVKAYKGGRKGNRSMEQEGQNDS